MADDQTLADEELLAPMEYDADLRSIPVTLTFDGVPKKYAIREIFGEKRDEYLNFVQSKMDMTKGVKGIGLKPGQTMQGLAAKILSMTLQEEGGDLVPIKTVQKLPPRIIDDLSERSLILSGLDTKAEDRAKNDD